METGEGSWARSRLRRQPGPRGRSDTSSVIPPIGVESEEEETGREVGALTLAAGPTNLPRLRPLSDESRVKRSEARGATGALLRSRCALSRPTTERSPARQPAATPSPSRLTGILRSLSSLRNGAFDRVSAVFPPLEAAPVALRPWITNARDCGLRLAGRGGTSGNPVVTDALGADLEELGASIEDSPRDRVVLLQNLALGEDPPGSFEGSGRPVAHALTSSLARGDQLFGEVAPSAARLGGAVRRSTSALGWLSGAAATARTRHAEPEWPRDRDRGARSESHPPRPSCRWSPDAARDSRARPPIPA